MFSLEKCEMNTEGIQPRDTAGFSATQNDVSLHPTRHVVLATGH